MPALKTHTLTSAALLSLLIVLLAALVRFVYPGVVEFKHDEATLSLLALDWLDGGAFPLTGMPSSVGVPNAPASVYVIALPFALGADALAATLFVAGLNVLGVGLLWFIAYRYLGTAPALVAGLVYALNPWAILYSRKIWAQDFHTPFLLLALLLGLYGFLEGRRWAQILCLPVLLFALQIHFAAWVLLPLYLWLLIAGGRRVSLPALLVSIVMGGLVMLPFALGIMQTLEHEPDRITGALNSADRALTLGEEALVFNAALATGTGIASEITPDQEHLIAPEMDILRPVWLVVYGAARLVGLEAEERVDGLFDDRGGVGRRDVFDVDAPLGGGDEDVAAGGAVGGDGEVILVRDVDARRDEQLADLEPLGAGLRGNHAVAEHEARGVGALFGRADELDEARLAAAAGVDLGLDDGERRTRLRRDALVCRGGVVDRLDDGAGGDGDSGVVEKLPGLVFVDFHGEGNGEWDMGNGEAPGNRQWGDSGTGRGARITGEGWWGAGGAAGA